MDAYGSRILVVEREGGRLAEILLREGYCVYTAKDGIDAIKEIRRRRFDVIVADFEVPWA